MLGAFGRFLSLHAFTVARLLVLALCAGIYICILLMNDGKLIYTLDDPYVHLSVSEQIWRGNYGINLGEFASPSSSILFPLLLTVGAFSATVHEYVPFIVNLLSLILTMEVLRVFLLRIGFGRTPATTAVAAAFVALSALCFNMICLVFTGMEQNLHIALTAATVMGFIVFLEERRISWWFAASAALLPIVRYEGLALTLAVVACIAVRGHWRAALGIGAFVVATVGGFSLFLVSHGLPFLPSSVLVKSALMSQIADNAGIGLLHRILGTLLRNLSSAGGLLIGGFAAIAAGFLWAGWRQRSLSNETLMAFVLLVFAAGQDTVGQFGWWGRYEIYGFVGGAMMTMYLLRASIPRILEVPEARMRLAAGGVVALLVVGFPYIQLTALTPVSANNIYEQQYQMHRFIVGFWRQPAAVADLGWSSYRNDNYIFDMAGLGSEEARNSLPQNDLTALDRIIQARGIKVAIFYRGWWLVNMPSHWQCIGTMHLSRRRGSALSAVLEFCATAPAYADELRILLREFQLDLPPRIKLDILPASLS